jgi:2-desacetyl-2-hydroxyethyl bacteriochlorophyllide A dehydrogenase
MMKALMIEAEGRTRFHTIPDVRPGPGEVRISVRHVGLCGSDYNTFKGLNPLVQLPRIPGHEIGGEILEAGAGVGPDFAIGRRVVVVPYTSCGQCSACRAGRANACRDNRTLGVQQDGGLADEIVVPAGKLILNDTLQPRHLALVEPLSVGFHAVARGRVQRADRVVVLGCGMIGMGAVIAAAAAGAEVVAVDVSAAKVDLARRFGAAHGCVAAGEDVAAAVRAVTGGDGADVVIEAVGLPATFTQAIDLACFAGRVVYIGYAKAPVTYQTQLFNLKELDILGSRNALPADFRAVIGYLEGAGMQADALITRMVPFAEAEDALDYWDRNRDSVLKLVIAR